MAANYYSCQNSLLRNQGKLGVTLKKLACQANIEIIRPPVRSNGRSSVLPVMFFSFFIFSFSEFPLPIALKLYHLIGICVYFITQVQKIGGGHYPKKISGPKTCKISVDFGPLQTLIANISGKAEDIQNRPALQTMVIPPAFIEKSPVNFSPLTAWNYMCVWTH